MLIYVNVFSHAFTLKEFYFESNNRMCRCTALRTWQWCKKPGAPVCNAIGWREAAVAIVRSSSPDTPPASPSWGKKRWACRHHPKADDTENRFPKVKSMVQKSSMSRTPSTSTQEIQMDMFDHHPHTQVGKGLRYDVTPAGKLHKLCKNSAQRGIFSPQSLLL